MRKLAALTASALLIAGAAVGLAGSAGATTATKTKPPVKLSGQVDNKGKATVSGDAVTIEQDDYSFTPTFLKGKAGSTVHVTVENEGDATHTFTIDKQDIDEQLSPGDTVKVDVTIPANGKSAAFYCSFHVGSGMQGAFYSKSGNAAKSTSDTSGGGYGY
jgi:plastocyanin